MSGILHWRFCGILSVILAAAMILPIACMAGSVAESSKPVVIANQPGDCKISIGKGEDARVGTKGVISRDGKDIAKFEITAVQWGYSSVTLSDLDAKDTVLIGDSVRLTDVPKPAAPKSSNALSKALYFVLFVGALVALGNHGGGGGATASTAFASVVTLQAQNTSLPADGTSTTTITATVVDSHNAAVPDGTAVSFSATSGAISPANAVTAGGHATAVLTAGSSAGVSTITASSGGANGQVTVTFIAGDQTSIGSLGLQATPTSIQVLNSGGPDTESVVVATARDAQGNLATGGTVTFTSSIGSITGVATINPATGQATTTFSSSQTGDALITASWLGASAQIHVTVTAGPPHSVTVESVPASVQCDGNSFATVTATVTDIAGNPVTDGTVVDFAVQSDTNGGGNGTITPEVRTAAGHASGLLFSRDSAGSISIPGTATVLVTVSRAKQLAAGLPAPASDLTNHATQVQLTSLDVAEIHIGATPLNIRGWDWVGNTTTVVAVVFDSHHNPVPDGTAVYFTAAHGMIYGNGGVAGRVALSTTALGRANATLVSDGSGNGSWHGLVDVTATSGTATITGTDLVTFSGPPIEGNCSISLIPTTLNACQDSATLIVTVLDTNLNPVTDDVKVRISANKGTLDNAQPPLRGGRAQCTLSTSADCANPTATGAGTVTVQIDSGPTDVPIQLTIGYTVL